MKRKLVIAYDKSDEEKYESLHWADEVEFGLVVVNDKPKPSLRELIDLCDGEMENMNFHSLTSIHADLAKIMVSSVGEEKAAEMMFEIAERGGIGGIARE